MTALTSFDELRQTMPDWAKDLRLNLASIEYSAVLTPRQLWGTSLASALACKQAQLVFVVATRAGEHLAPHEREAAAGAAAIMAMNNVYYTFTRLVGDARYRSMPARLRMQIFGKPGVDTIDFELWCLAVSAINGCASCIDNHERALVKAGGTAEQVHEAIRVAAIVTGVAQALDAQAMLAQAMLAG